MTIFQAFVLGVIQGLTEFIPVSSTAHLLIGQALLEINDDRLFSFQIIVQLGTVLALLVYFWREISAVAKAFLLGLWHQEPFATHESRLGWLLIVATVPALLAGFILRDTVEIFFQVPLLQAGVRLLMSAVLLGGVEYFGKRNRKLESASWKDALTVGLFQILALFPGASRSGTTLAGGIARGFDRRSAARFAFFMSIPILLAAGGYEMLQVVEMDGTLNFLPYLGVGFTAAALVGWLSIKWLIDYLSKHSLYGFAIYCAIAGSFCALSVVSHP